MKNLPEEIIVNHIYGFLLGREYALINKAAYLKYKQWKQKAIDTFYAGECNQDSCGHKNATTRLIWKKLINVEITTKVCRCCFAWSFYKFMTQYAIAPYHNFYGKSIYETIFNTRRNNSEKEYIEWIESEPFQDFRKMNIDEYTIHQTCQEKNNTLLKKVLLKIQIQQIKKHIKSYEYDIKRAQTNIEKYKNTIENMKNELLVLEP